MTNTATDARQTYDMTHDTTLRHNTIASITLEAGSAKRTVQRWVNKCGDIGILRDNTRYFSDIEKAQILSYQSKRAADDEAVEGELIEPGAIELHTSAAQTAAPLIQFNIETLNVHIRSADTSALDRQSEQFDDVSRISASAIAQAISAEFSADIAQIRSRQKNLAKGIEAQALANVARSMTEAE